MRNFETMGFLNNRARAFGFALAGLRSAFRSELHLKIHAVAALSVIALGCYVSLAKADWIVISGCITLVICLELANSAIEKLCNRLVPQQDDAIKYVKDVMAGAVLLACVFAVIAGCLVFYPYLKNIFF